MITDAVAVIVFITVIISKLCIWRSKVLSQHLMIVGNSIVLGHELVYSFLARFVGDFSEHFSLLCLTYFVIFTH